MDPPRPRQKAGRQAGQVLAEAALTLPLVLILILGTMQVALLTYGVIVARFAVFSGLRASATVAGVNPEPAGIQTASRIISSAPGLTLVWASMKQVPLPLRGVALATRRLTLTVLVKVPRVIPSRRLMPLDTVSASGAMPMEPAR